jgi:signal peptidase I
MGIVIKWFLFRTVRQAVAVLGQVRKTVHAQSDILKPEAIEALNGACANLRKTLDGRLDKQAVLDAMQKLEETYNRFIKPYPFPSVRDNIEMFLVAIAVAMAIRTFFLQPFKIPTGSMQPTLYGITHEDFRGRNDVVMPTGIKKFISSWVRGESYYHVVAKSDGYFDCKPMQRFAFFNLFQTFTVGPDTYTIWFPPDRLLERAGLAVGGGNFPRVDEQTGKPPFFKKGEDILKIMVRSGDHLFVDRVTYNFRHPRRGEIIVFETYGTRIAQQDQFYIKRMVAMGGDKISIGNDRHLVINGRRLDANTPRFEFVYSFDPKAEYRENTYFGHVNNETAMAIYERYNWPAHKRGMLAPEFPDERTVYTVPDNCYLAMGDNTMNSSDSRFWGALSRTNVIGKSFFVYWPITERFGWAHLAHH